MSTRPGDLQLTFRERLLRRITIDLEGPRPVDDAPCWTWTGKTTKAGYGTYRDQLAHRLVYEQLHAPIPDGLELDHLCRNPPCVNPAHLDPVTHPENCRRGIAGAITKARMLANTHCARGHEWTAENTKQTPRQRKCRQCIREDSAAAHARRKASA
jgi:hypothetical protein